MELASYFSILVYPFVHSVVGDERTARLRTLKSRWRPWWSRFNEEALQARLDDTYYLLPHVRQLLFPETALLPLGTNNQLAEARRVSTESIEQLVTRIHPDGLVRLTIDPLQLQALQPLQLELERSAGEDKSAEDFVAAVRLDWVDVMLFPQQVGFLAAKVEIADPNPSVDRVGQFLSLSRLVHSPRLDWQLASWRRVGPEARTLFQTRDLVDYLLEGLTDLKSDLDSSLDEFLARSRQDQKTARYTMTESGEVYGASLRLFSYACLNQAAAELELQGKEAGQENSVERVEPNEAAPRSPVPRALFALATTTPVDAPDFRLHPQGLAEFMDQGHIAIYANWQAMALRDSVVFLGAYTSRFTLRDLPENVENDYFYLYLLSLYQQLRLSLLSGELMRQGGGLDRNLQEARILWDDFFSFRNHYWFSEVTFRPMGNQLYERFQRGLGVFSLYESVSSHIRDLQEHFERKADRRISSLLNFLTFVGLPASILVSLFGNALIKDASWEQFLVTALVTYAATAIIWIAWRRLGRD